MDNKKHNENSRQEVVTEGAKEQSLAPGIELLMTLRVSEDRVKRIAWSPYGSLLAIPRSDGPISLWNFDTKKWLAVLDGHEGGTNCVAFDTKGKFLVSGGQDGVAKVWDFSTGRLLHKLTAHSKLINGVAFNATGNLFATASENMEVKLWEVSTGNLIRELDGHKSEATCVAINPRTDIVASGDIFDKVLLWLESGELILDLATHQSVVASVAFTPDGTKLVTGSYDTTIKLWDLTEFRLLRKFRLLRTFEGHTTSVTDISVSADGKLIASRSNSEVGLWATDTGERLVLIPVPNIPGNYTGIALHPREPLLATVASDSSEKPIVQIWQLDIPGLLELPPSKTSHYVNAKVVLLGDTGVGKSGLSLVLNGKPFEATDSTPGRRVWTLESLHVKTSNDIEQTRETLLWDLAGQPGYRVIHQLHLNEVAVALIVFDARSEIDPLAGVRHWERALRLAQQRQGTASVPMKKFLVSARADRGTVSVSKERLESLLKDFRFDGYFETSAKEGWQIEELRQVIKAAIPWDVLPEVSSSLLFTEIKDFLLTTKKTGRLVAPASQLYDEFVQAHPELEKTEANLRDQFETCIGRLENRDLIRRLSFGGYVLLQPELLDAYASAMVNAAKDEPDGYGSVPEDVAISGQFYVPEEQKVADRGQEQLLLHATVEELARHDLALKESASDGSYLVFPSQFNRDYEDAPEPKGKSLALTFEGPVQSLYATLAVRLGHSGLFTTGRAEMWRNAAIFSAKAGGKCGIYLHEFAEGRGRLLIFYDQHAGHTPSYETRFNFEEFILAHARQRALDATVEVVRFFVCAGCGNPVPDSYVQMLRDRNLKSFDCPCGKNVSLEEPKDRLQYISKVETMEKTANRQRDLEMFVQSARGETRTPNFTAWAGDERVTLAIVFTDVVGSTALGEELRDSFMNEVRRAHFSQSRSLIERFNGREIKTIGDSFMAAFRSVEKALDYAQALQANPGPSQIQIRAGIHIGPMQVEDDDVFGGAVNFAARVVGAIKGAEIWLSDRAKEDLDRGGAKHHKQLTWIRHEDVEMKGFNGGFTLWSLQR